MSGMGTGRGWSLENNCKRLVKDVLDSALTLVRIGQAIQPLINLLQDHLLASDILHGDETIV